MLGRLAAFGYDDVHVSCNISTRQFHNKCLLSDIQNALERYGITPGVLAIEIAESVMMEQIEVTLELLRRIKALGVHVCVDDFGTGYSSPSCLRQRLYVVAEGVEHDYQRAYLEAMQCD